MLREKARALAAVAILATVATLVGGVGTSAAKAPASFFGVVPQTSLQPSDFDRMGAGKVGTVRTLMNWSTIDQTASGTNDWSSIDPIVLEAAKNGIEVLPFIYGTPQWVATDLDGQNCTPAKCALYAPKSAAALNAFETFVGEAVERYGPQGTFWTQHPDVPKSPIEAWQIWNEQNSKSFYAPKPSPKGYAKLLASANAAIGSRDPAADLVLGGMPELAGSRKATRGSEYLAQLYDVKGASKNFDGVAPHPYGATLTKVTDQVKVYRKVMNGAGDRKAGMWVTEVGAGSASGGNPLNRGTKGQARLLTEIYKYLIKHRSKLKIQQVDWFSWMDSQQSICSWCATSGLLTQSGKAKPSFKAFTKLSGGSAG